MPSIYQRKSADELKRPPRTNVPIRIIKQALEDVKSKIRSIRNASKHYGIPKSTLWRYLRNDNIPSETLSNFSSVHVSRQIFTIAEENMLVEYLIHAAHIHYGLTKKQVKTLAYQFAKANKKNIPNTWSQHELASEDWYKGFVHRNSGLSLRKPEATSLSRATSFNKKNVDEFFQKLKNIYEKYNFAPQSVYNIDETGVSTVQVPGKILAKKGTKQVGKVTSAERGTTVTVCCGINAIGNSVPPFFIFPRVNFKDFMLKNAPVGSAGAAHSTGWMTSENFLKYLEHFIMHVKPSKERPILLIYDNHESHISLDVINLAKDNGIVILTLPPHCSNKLQPLDVGVFAPFKKFYNSAVDSFMLNNPGKTVTIYDIAELVAEAFLKAFVQKNIINSFAKTGISPFNPEVFTDEELLCSSVTDREEPSASSSINDITKTSVIGSTSENQKSPNDAIASTSAVQELPNALNSNQIISPAIVMPFPKAPPRKRPTSGRKPGKSRILTDTPEKNQIEEALLQKIAKNTKLKQVKKKVLSSSSESESSVEFDDSDIENAVEEDQFDETDFTNVECGDFIIVKFTSTNTKSNIVHYIGKILSLRKRGFEIIFLRRHGISNRFHFPLLEDKQIIEQKQAIKKLKQPQFSNKRSNFLVFDVGQLNVTNLR